MRSLGKKLTKVWEDYFYYPIMQRIRNTLKGISNLIKFFPVIWSYREYDFSYFLKIQNETLKSMAKYFKESSIAADREDIARRIELTVNLMEKYAYCFDDYLEEKKGLRKEWIYINMKNCKDYPNLIKCCWTEEEKGRDRFKQHIWRAEKMWNLYWEILKTNTRSWWD